MRFKCSVTILSLLVFSTFTQAQSTATDMGPIHVFGHKNTDNLVEFIPSVTKVAGKELQKKRQTSLGDTIGSEAGVTSTGFGPSAGRPVIRGLDGDRVRVLQNGLGTLDASTQSVDHAIPIDPLTIDQIEIVRGPMSLLYGSSAVGGVVNIVTNRIKNHYEEGAHAQVLSQAETVNYGLSNAVMVDYGFNQWVMHVDASTRNLNHQHIPGYARTAKLRNDDPNPADKTEGNKILPNSYNKQDAVGVGATKIFEKGNLGVSYNHFETDYGTVAEQNVDINMNQNRYELAGEYQSPFSLFNKFKLKSAQSDYKHREKDLGVVGTTFTNSGNESRLEAINQQGNLEGISGVQTQTYRFSAKGDEAFLPKSATNKVALFTYQELKVDQNSYSVGGRAEKVMVEKFYADNFGTGAERDFLSYNASLGYLRRLNETNSVSLSLSYTERAPNFQELYAGGPHVATNIYEAGQSNLRKEKAYAAELGYKLKNDNHQLGFNLFAQKFDGFIILSPTGETDTNSSMPISNYNQLAASIYGADMESKHGLWQTTSGKLSLISKADILRGRESSSMNNLPRLTPPRLTVGLEFEREAWSLDLEAVNVMRQTKTAPNETQTEAYTLTNAGYTYNFLGEKTALSTFFRVRNIFDVEARNHVSTLKDVAPLPGRNFMLGLQLSI